MRALVVTPAPPGSHFGNRVTARRWAGMLRDLELAVEIVEEYRDQPADLMVALHARKSAPSIARFHRRRSTAPLIVGLTGTDLYCDLPTNPDALRSLGLATRLIVLHPRGGEAVPEHLRAKVRPIVQSSARIAATEPPAADRFEVCVLGHLRPVKDPFRTAAAARLLPPESRLRVIHVGAARTPEMAEQAQAEMARNERYTWVGDLPRRRALGLLARCRLLALTSLHEGGANAISEALVHGVPVVASSIPGSVGLLGDDYPGYFPPGDTAALAALLASLERDAHAYAELHECCRRLAPLFAPRCEREAWRALLVELSSLPAVALSRARRRPAPF